MKLPVAIAAAAFICSTTEAAHSSKRQLLSALRGFTPRDSPSVDDVYRRRGNRENPGRFRNDKTSAFAVNGSAVPDVDFDLGESYAGLLPITDNAKDGELYFWFFPTSSEEFQEEKEIVIWLNGGPGCSSLLGFAQENGPLMWAEGMSKPLRNPWGWNRLTNVVWVEQPISVGFTQGNVSISNEDELAEQFLGFWENFIKLFDMDGWKVYIAAESYGGMYGPYIASHMLDAREKYRNDKTDAFNMAGLMIVDGAIGDNTNMVITNVAAFDKVLEHPDAFPFTETTLSKLQKTATDCGFLDYHRRHLQFPPSEPPPTIPPGIILSDNGTLVVNETCSGFFLDIYDQASVINACWSWYNIYRLCPFGDENIKTSTSWFDKPAVKRAINAPIDTKWSICADGTGFLGPDGGQDESLSPDQKQLPHVIDVTQNVILAQGYWDLLVNPNGVLLAVQNMTWGKDERFRGFQTAPSDPFYVPLWDEDGTLNFAYELPSGAGVQGTTHSERGLTFVVNNFAGHELPAYAPASSWRMLEKLLGRVSSLSEVSPFGLNELKNVTQLGEPLGNGTIKIPCFGQVCKV